MPVHLSLTMVKSGGVAPTSATTILPVSATPAGQLLESATTLTCLFTVLPLTTVSSMHGVLPSATQASIEDRSAEGVATVMMAKPVAG